MNHDPVQNPGDSRTGFRAVQLIFFLWLLFVNIFYYLQFRSVFLSLLARWIRQ